MIAGLNLSRDHAYSVLDFGCGTGEFLSLVSEKVSAHSKLTGVDAAESSLAAASRSYPGIDFICEKFVNTLGFRDASFDIVVTTDVFECISDKNAAISEIHRILKPRGRVLAAHWDWDTMLYNADSKDSARRAVAAFSRWKQPWMDNCDGQMGRKLWGLFESSGKFRGVPDSFNLIETAYRPGTYGFDRMQEIAKLTHLEGVERSQYEKLVTDLIEKDQRKTYFFSVTSFLYYGEKL